LRRGVRGPTWFHLEDNLTDRGEETWWRSPRSRGFPSYRSIRGGIISSDSRADPSSFSTFPPTSHVTFFRCCYFFSTADPTPVKVSEDITQGPKNIPMFSFSDSLRWLRLHNLVTRTCANIFSKSARTSTWIYDLQAAVPLGLLFYPPTETHNLRYFQDQTLNSGDMGNQRSWMIMVKHPLVNG